MNWTLATTAFFDRRVRKFLTKHPDLRVRLWKRWRNCVPTLTLPLIFRFPKSFFQAPPAQ